MKKICLLTAISVALLCIGPACSKTEEPDRSGQLQPDEESGDPEDTNPEDADNYDFTEVLADSAPRIVALDGSLELRLGEPGTLMAITAAGDCRWVNVDTDIDARVSGLADLTPELWVRSVAIPIAEVRMLGRDGATEWWHLLSLDGHGYVVVTGDI